MDLFILKHTDCVPHDVDFVFKDKKDLFDLGIASARNFGFCVVQSQEIVVVNSEF
jgi:hypothetical protein